jgi:hypothetical protein
MYSFNAMSLLLKNLLFRVYFEGIHNRDRTKLLAQVEVVQNVQIVQDV